jgi:hypothetical protein
MGQRSHCLLSIRQQRVRADVSRWKTAQLPPDNSSCCLMQTSADTADSLLL